MMIQRWTEVLRQVPLHDCDVLEWIFVVVNRSLNLIFNQ